jgi:general secretion pathway protein G
MIMIVRYRRRILLSFLAMLVLGTAGYVHVFHRPGDNVLHAREGVLKEDLFTLRQAIEQFTQDKTRAPQSLDDLVTAGYLRAIPKDPFTGAPDWQEDVLPPGDQNQTRIDDVHSSSNLISSDGTAYSSW